jgi:molybdate transport repressor ModE-like protein
MTPKINLARIHLPSLRLVVLCAESGSISAAAPRASLSITGASYKLRALEELLGVALFQRNAGGLQATEAGVPIIDRCREIVESVQIIVDTARATSVRQQHGPVCPACGHAASAAKR